MKISLFCILLTCIQGTAILRAQTISTIAGNGIAGSAGDGGQATAAEINRPYCVYVDGSHNIYIGDVIARSVRKVSPSGIISTFAGGGIGLGDGGPATAAEIDGPVGITGDASGNIYISDAANNRVRMVNSAGVIYTAAGGGSILGDGGPATAAILAEPTGIAIDGAGNLYISDGAHQSVRKVNTSGIITTYAGNGTLGYTGDGGPATAADLASPFGLATDGIGNLFISDEGNYTIRRVNPAGIITTIAGTGTSGFSGDGGAATMAELIAPTGVAVDAAGNLYIADWENERIRKVASGIITTYAGSGVVAYGGDGGLAVLASFAEPWGVATDGSGNVYIADSYDHRIRFITDTLAIGAVTGDSVLCYGTATALHDTTAGGAWSSSDISIATIGSGTGIVTAVAAGIAIMSYTLYGISVIDTVHVIVPFTGTIAGDSVICPDSSTTLASSPAGGVWSSANSLAAVGSTGLVTAGLIPGRDTIEYILTNGCGTDTSRYQITIVPGLCVSSDINGGSAIPAALNVFPNPGGGAFTVLLTSPDREPASVTITNTLGEKVREMSIISNEPVAVALHQPSGLYFISATVAGRKYFSEITVVQ